MLSKRFTQNIHHCFTDQTNQSTLYYQRILITDCTYCDINKDKRMYLCNESFAAQSMQPQFPIEHHLSEQYKSSEVIICNARQASTDWLIKKNIGPETPPKTKVSTGTQHRVRYTFCMLNCLGVTYFAAQVSFICTLKCYASIHRHGYVSMPLLGAHSPEGHAHCPYLHGFQPYNLLQCNTMKACMLIQTITCITGQNYDDISTWAMLVRSHISKECSCTEMPTEI